MIKSTVFAIAFMASATALFAGEQGSKTGGEFAAARQADRQGADQFAQKQADRESSGQFAQRQTAGTTEAEGGVYLEKSSNGDVSLQDASSEPGTVTLTPTSN